jgi:hypothetical protein
VAILALAVGGFLVQKYHFGSHSSVANKIFATIISVVIGVIALLQPNFVALKSMIVLALVFWLVGDILIEVDTQGGQDNAGALGLPTLFWWWLVLCAFVFSLLVGAVVICNSGTLKAASKGERVKFLLYFALMLFMVITSVCLSFAEWLVLLLAFGYILFFASEILQSPYTFGADKNGKIALVAHILHYIALLMIATFAYFL